MSQDAGMLIDLVVALLILTSRQWTHVSFLLQKIPRVDINAPANTIEYHPALLAHADDAAGSAAHSVMLMPASHVNATFPVANTGTATTESEDSDITDEDLSDDSLGSDESDLEALASLSPADRAEYERFGAEYKGPTLSEESASRLLILMLHASTCPCRYVSMCSVIVFMFSETKRLTFDVFLLQSQIGAASRGLQKYKVDDDACSRLSRNNIHI